MEIVIHTRYMYDIILKETEDSDLQVCCCAEPTADSLEIHNKFHVVKVHTPSFQKIHTDRVDCMRNWLAMGI